MAWNNPSSALHAGVLPSFLYGRGAQNWWLAHEVLSSEMRLFFDASSLVLGLYPESISAMQHVMASSKNGRLPSVSWEYGVNHHLAAVYGSYCCRSPARRFPMLHRVVKQSEDYMLSKVDTLVSSDFFISKQGNAHGVDSLRKKQNVSLSGYLHGCSSETSAPDLPYSLSMLLDLVADENGSVVLGVAGKSYRDMLMSWACRLRRLRVTNFLVCALDHETYEFSILQVVIFCYLGFFYAFQTTDRPPQKLFNSNSRGCQFSETHCHQQMSALTTATLERSVFNK
jgi:beta-arabinofuranosyltransferase